ncbi:MFS transporter [Peribacillus saganii]|uniref:MFS transporter n=1 Tax=Peribacillus saganii TaxID=2303992 RepID=A0A372LTV4_9BACI|nr:MFS transporter [Peribacillus saganii]RFU70984.1 MFS transporter [Peribacillus saganii]
MLRNRNVWILMSGEFLAGLGMWLGVIGNLEFLQKLVPSDFHKSLILLAGMFAGLLVGPLAGRVIDKYSKKKVLVYSGIVRIFSILFMFIAISYDQVFWMVIYMVVIGISAAFYFPALQAAIPLIVKNEDLLSINGLHMNVSTISRISGTSLAGILLISISLFNLYFLTLLSYILILLCTFFLTIDESKAVSVKQKQTKSKGGFTEVLPLLKTMPQVVMSLFLMLVPTLFLGSFNLMVLEISELQHDSSIKGWLYTAEGLSFMIGAFITKKLSAGRDPVRILIGCAVTIAVAHLSLYLADIKIASIISFAIFGFSVGIFFPVVATIFQKQVPKEYHGRFFSFRGMMDRILFQVVLVTAGLFLDTIGFKNMILCFGSVSVLLIIFIMLKQPRSAVVEEVKSPSA